MHLPLALAALVAAANPDAKAQALLEARHLEGVVLVQDVASGAVVANASTGADWDKGILPLSTTKLFLAVLAWERDQKTAIDVNALIATGSDNDGRALALELRHAMGSNAMLAALARYGFPRCRAGERLDCFDLSEATRDADWADTLSLGEARIRVTPKHLCEFLRKFKSAKLESAMHQAVRSGTARAIARNAALLGGKTGTGPAAAAPYDGVFAGLMFDAKGAARYSFVVYLRHGGRGGVVAAQVARDMAAFLVD